MDAGDNPIEEVAALAMAADDSGDSDLFTREPLTEPFLIDLDADDDDAMADYAFVQIIFIEKIN